MSDVIKSAVVPSVTHSLNGHKSSIIGVTKSGKTWKKNIKKRFSSAEIKLTDGKTCYTKSKERSERRKRVKNELDSIRTKLKEERKKSQAKALNKRKQRDINMLKSGDTKIISDTEQIKRLMTKQKQKKLKKSLALVKQVPTEQIEQIMRNK